MIETSKDNKPISLKDATRENYKFLGWYDLLDVGAKKLSVVNEEMTVYAKWQRNN